MLTETGFRLLGLEVSYPVAAFVLLAIGAAGVIIAMLSEKHVKRLFIPGVCLVLLGIGIFITDGIYAQRVSDSTSNEPVADAPEKLSPRCEELKEWLEGEGFSLDKDSKGNERCAQAKVPEGSTIDDVNEDDVVAYIQEESGVVGYLLTDDGDGGFKVVTSNVSIEDAK